MTTVLKAVPIRMVNEQKVPMHWVATVLDIKMHEDGTPVLYLKTPSYDSTETTCLRAIYMAADNEELPKEARNHIATIVGRNGIGFHFFEGATAWRRP